MVFEHRMLLPSVGLAGLACVGFVRALENNRLRTSAGLLASTLVVLWVLATMARVPVWRDEITLYEHAVEFAPGSARAHYNLATHYAQAGRTDDAERAFNDLLSLDAEHEEGLFNRGVLLATKGRPNEAIRDYTRALAVDPEHIQAYVNRGTLYEQIGRTDLAWADYSSVVSACELLGEEMREHDKVEHCSAGYNNRGLLRRRRGDAVGALEDFSIALTLSPRQVDVLVNRGSTYMLIGQAEPALRDLGGAVELDPGNAKALFRMGLAYAGAMRPQEAEAAFLRACSLGKGEACQRLSPQHQ
jgi:tetratricopeptide (TPR) repeat protein